MARNHETYRGSGNQYMKVVGAATALKLISNTSMCDFEFEESVEQLRAGKGNAVVDEDRQISDVQLKTKVHSFNAAELAIGLRAGVESVAAGTVTGEVVKGYKGGLIRLAHVKPAEVVVKSQGGTPITYVAGTDYVVQDSGLLIPSTSSIVNGDNLVVDYEHDDYDIIEALVNSGMEYQFHFDGLNSASGKSVLIDVYRFKPGLVANLQWHGDSGFASFEMTGAILADLTKPAGKSQYFAVHQQKQAT